MVRTKRGAKKAAKKTAGGRRHDKHRATDNLVHKKMKRINRKHWVKRIKLLQQSTKNVVPKLSFARVVKEIIQNERPHQEFRVQKKAMDLLHVAAESYIVSMFENANITTLHAHRKTVMPQDLKLIKRIETTRNVVLPEQQLSYFDDQPTVKRAKAPVKPVVAPATTSVQEAQDIVSETETDEEHADDEMIVPPTPDEDDEDNEEQLIPVRTPSTVKSPPAIKRLVSIKKQRCSLQSLF